MEKLLKLPEFDPCLVSIFTLQIPTGTVTGILKRMSKRPERFLPPLSMKAAHLVCLAFRPVELGSLALNVMTAFEPLGTLGFSPIN